MTLSLIILLWACLAVFALALKCESGRPYLTFCEAFWIVTMDAALFAGLGLSCFLLGMGIGADWRVVLLLFGCAGTLIGIFELGIYIGERLGSCPVIWRRKP